MARDGAVREAFAEMAGSLVDAAGGLRRVASSSEAIGARYVLSTQPLQMSDGDALIARALADLVAVSILQHHAAEGHRRTSVQLVRALGSGPRRPSLPGFVAGRRAAAAARRVVMRSRDLRP